MKITKHPLPEFARLCAHIGEDPIRINQRGVYFDKDLPFAIAQDGYRLFASRALHRLECSGGLADGEVFAAHNSIVLTRDAEYPDYKALIADKAPTACVDFQVPAWVKKLKRKDKAPITFGLPGSGDAHVQLGGYFEPNPDEATPIITLDLALLAPYAGDTIRLWFSGDKQAVLITDTRQELRNLTGCLGLDWFGLVMPMRGIGSLVSRVSLAKEQEAELPAIQEAPKLRVIQ